MPSPTVRRLDTDPVWFLNFADFWNASSQKPLFETSQEWKDWKKNDFIEKIGLLILFEPSCSCWINNNLVKGNDSNIRIVSTMLDCFDSIADFTQMFSPGGSYAKLAILQRRCRNLLKKEAII